MIASLLTVTLLVVMLGISPVPVAAASCATSGPASGTYIVTVCLTQPVSGALVSGDVTVTASVTTSGAAPLVQRMIYTLDGQYLLTEFSAPYRFTLPTAQFVDGQHTLSVAALMSDGFTTGSTSSTLFFQNGITAPPPIPSGFQPTSGSAPPSGQPFRVVAVGDGGDDGTYSAQVAQLIGSQAPNLVLYLGDLYEEGSYTEFLNYYGSAGQLFAAYRSITNPVVGNHEYEGGIAAGYLRYWQSPPDYYSVDAGGWHVIVLNSNSRFGQYGPGSPQYEWLLRDLQTHRDACTIVAFHHPRFSIGPQGDTPALQAMWELLYQFGVELVVVGHDHNYQRWVPLDRNGQPDPNGIVQIVSGTGGHGIRAFVRSDARVAAGYDQPPDGFGVLVASLATGRADLSFVDLSGRVRDTTSLTCHGPNDTTPPTAPTGVTASLISSQEVAVFWAPGTDDYAVTAYEVLRDGSTVATVSGTQRTFVDRSLQPARTYTYQVVALDAVGNRSAASAPVTISTDTTVFLDDFESGSLGRWSTVNGLTVTNLQPRSGQYAAQAQSTQRTAAYGVAHWPSALTDGTVESWVFIAARGNHQLTLLRMRAPDGTGLGSVQINTNGLLAFRNEVAGTTTTTSVSVAMNSWHRIVLHLSTGTNGRVDLWYDGTQLIGRAQSFGSSAIGQLQIGDHVTGRTFDVRFDDVRVTAGATSPPDTSPPETTLTSTPPASTDQTSATFAFTASEPATFRCSLDGAPGQPCTSPVNFSGLAIGTHTFSVVAVDAAGNVDPTPASYAWDVIAPATPETTLLSTPPALTNLASATFTFSSSDAAATFECQLDSTSSVVCSTPWTVNGLAEGTHTFTVRAIDGEGNPDPTPASWSWTVDLTPPTPPPSLTATPLNGTQVSLSWSSVSDANGIAGYDVLRDGNLLFRLGPVTSATDATVQPASTYRYTVRARDNAGNLSGESPVATVTTPSLRLFEDDFESGTLVRWSSVNGLTVTTEAPFSGNYAARAFSTAGTASYALATLPRSVSDFSVRIRFQVVSQGANTVYLVKWRSGTSSLGGVYLTSTGQLAVRNDIAAQGSSTTTSITSGTWHTLEVHVRTGSDGFVEIWYDGTRIHQSFQNFGTNQVTGIQLGENSTGRLFDVRFDEVVADTGPIDAPADTTPPETTLTSTPPASTAVFAFSANELATFRCSLDGTAAQPCTSPVSYTGLTAGIHTFSVTAVDLAGNVDPTPATFSWEITAAPAAPDTVLTTTPSALTNSSTATFAFASDDPNATFRCQLDGATPSTCTSPLTLENLTEGAHTFTVAAVNSAGVADPSPASWTWTIDLTPPPAPSSLTAVAGNGRVTITWQASSDPNGIAGYDVYRDGTLLVSLGDTTSYVDTTVQPNSTYSYAVATRDQAGNASPPSTPVTVTTTSFALFADDFESGTLADWSTVSGLTLTNEQPYSGQYAARALSTSGTAASASAILPSTTSDVYVRVRFFVSSQGANTVYLLKLRTATGGSLGGIFLSSTGKLGFRNDVAGQSTTTTTGVTPGTWHTLLLHVVVGTNGSVEIWYDGNQIATISGNLGTDPVGRFQLGENSTGRTFDIRFDEVVVDTQLIAG
ncbi:metallophosphoesterase [Thermomicrobium sp. 4228-Ro]|uniref:fibronectin type III domain-containing protein n=1 Tax=Thermomicrobium sp. 4228-Ro TaxID=2993937 RepID=UPI00224905B1|nr:Ig-like domain-containing protein [Thermomicrobium sp. 4228-Ro]MCX2726787.1 metallophosphoesterase [Thermomicrobium sp. 4228-Ro]